MKNKYKAYLTFSVELITDQLVLDNSITELNEMGEIIKSNLVAIEIIDEKKYQKEKEILNKIHPPPPPKPEPSPIRFILEQFKIEQFKKNKYIKGLPYTGSKYNIIDQIIPLFPSNIDTFIEPFVGGCNIAPNVAANKYYLSDANESLYSLYLIIKQETRFIPEFLITSIKDIIKKFNLNKQNKDGYEELKKTYNESINQPIYLLVLIYHSFCNQIRFNKKGEFNLPFGKREFHEKHEKNLRDFAYFFHRNNEKIFFTTIDFYLFLLNRIEEARDNKNSFIYLDPPYFETKATYNERNNWNSFKEKMLYTMLDFLIKYDIKFGLSNVFIDDKPSFFLGLFIDKNKDKLKIHFLDKNYDNCNYHRKNKKLKEVYICNY